MKSYCKFILAVIVTGTISAQTPDRETETGFSPADSLQMREFKSDAEISAYINNKLQAGKGIALGGYVSSVYNEALDSVALSVSVNGKAFGQVYTTNGLFIIGQPASGSLIDVQINHPEYHVLDTAIVVGENNPEILHIQLSPKYKILIRGRVYSGNLPLPETRVKVRYREEEFNLVTRDCYYDEEDYWNCLYNGMFKLSLTADNPDDSVRFFFSREGMKPLEFGMRFKDYSGEILKLKMHYDNKLPNIPKNTISLKLSFPFISNDKDWFMGLSYYRLINESNLRRFALGLDANMYITSISSEIETLEGLEPARYDSSYVTGSIGPSVLFWFVAPENRRFGSYAGCTFAWHVGRPELIFQPMVGTRYFLDQNKSLSLELRYAEFTDETVRYTFNYYGNSYRSTVEQSFSKLHLNIGIQVVF